MDRYQKVVSQGSSKTEPVNENEIRITSQGLVRNYLTYALTLLNERKGKEIVFKAMGQAISKAVTIAEIIKRKLPYMHQDTVINSVSVTDVWEPIEEGLVRVEQTRQVSVISITLSPNVLDKNSPGYQAPALQQMQLPRQGRVIYHAATEDSFGRGQASGRRGGRGWSRGQYSNYQENGGYPSRNGGGGRGQSWGNRDYNYDGSNGYSRGNDYLYTRGDGYYRRGGQERENGYVRGSRYERDNGNRRGGAGNEPGNFVRGGGYEQRGGGNYERGGGYEQRGGGNYERGGGYEQRGGGNYERGGRYEQRGGANYERGGGYEQRGGGNYERGGGYDQQRGRGGGRRGGYGLGRMGGRGRDDGY